MPVDPWVIWVVIAAILLMVDLFIIGGTDGLRLTWTVMALAGAGAAWAAPDSIATQLVTAALVGLVTLPVLLWLFRRATSGEAGASHDDPRLQERVVTVEQRDTTTGIVFLGDFFPARHVEGAPLRSGDRVRIQRFEGITAVVAPANDDFESI